MVTSPYCARDALASQQTQAASPRDPRPRTRRRDRGAQRLPRATSMIRPVFGMGKRHCPSPSWRWSVETVYQPPTPPWRSSPLFAWQAVRQQAQLLVAGTRTGASGRGRARHAAGLVQLLDIVAARVGAEQHATGSRASSWPSTRGSSWPARGNSTAFSKMPRKRPAGKGERQQVLVADTFEPLRAPSTNAAIPSRPMATWPRSLNVRRSRPGRSEVEDRRRVQAPRRAGAVRRHLGSRHGRGRPSPTSCRR